MGYSITTKDGITIQNIPDDVPADSPELRERVAKIRAGSGALEAQPEGFGARLDRELSSIPRQVGLTARHGIEGVTESLGVLSEPIRQGLNLIPGVNLPTARTGGRALSDTLGLPSPETAQERVVGDASRLMAGVATFGGLAGRGAQATTGTAQNVLSNLSANPAQQLAGAASAGAAGGYTRETGGGAGAQFAASLAGGLAGAAGAGGVQRIGTALSNLAANLRRARTPAALVNVRIDQILRENGVTVGQIPAQVRAELAEEVRRAMDAGQPISPQVVQRLADYGMVGATPTRGTVTLDPVTITQERNLAKFGANSQDATLQQLARLQNANNAQLIQRLNDTGGAGPFAQQRVASGDAVTGAIRARDAAARTTEQGLYNQARQSAGRDIPLDRDGFVLDAYQRLAAENKGAFLPDNINRLLEQIRAGKIRMDGQEFDVPFNVDVLDSLKTTLATATRGAADGNTRRALSLVRQALDDAPIASKAPQTGSQLPVAPGTMERATAQGDDLSADAMRAFDRARRFARARRGWQESAPGISAALDDVPADRFVQDFILGESNRSSYRDVAQMVRTLQRDPGAMQAARERITGWLKEQAIGRGKADEVGAFSPTGYNKALDQLGDGKLRLFFTPDDITQLRAIGRVASYETFQPRGSAVNNSNTAATAAGMLDRIASSQLISRLPMGDSLLRQPAMNWSAQIRASEALTPMNALLARQAMPPQPRNALVPMALPLIVPQQE